MIKKAKRMLHIALGTAILIILALGFTVDCARAYGEKHYQDEWCAGKGKPQRMPDGTHCDCVTPKHAIEFDFGKKWYEAVGQSLHYSLQTGKRAGIVLILENKKDRRYWIRLNSLILHFGLPIDTWAVGEGK